MIGPHFAQIFQLVYIFLSISLIHASYHNHLGSISYVSKQISLNDILEVSDSDHSDSHKYNVCFTIHIKNKIR